MNKGNPVSVFFSCLAVVSAAFLLATPARAQAQANSHGEEFFIISSVDQQKHQVVLMRPTQLTVVADLGAQTVCLDEKGHKLTSKDLRAGDTVWAIIKPGKNGATSAVRIREGAMTQAEMQKLYLHYDTVAPSGLPLAPKPISPAPESGTVQTETPPASGSSVAPTTLAPSNLALQRSHKTGHTRHRRGTIG